MPLAVIEFCRRASDRSGLGCVYLALGGAIEHRGFFLRPECDVSTWVTQVCRVWPWRALKEWSPAGAWTVGTLQALSENFDSRHDCNPNYTDTLFTLRGHVIRT